MKTYSGSFCSTLVLLTVKGRWDTTPDFSLFAGLKRIGVDFHRVFYQDASLAAIGWTGPGKISATEAVKENDYRRRTAMAMIIAIITIIIINSIDEDDYSSLLSLSL